VWDILGAQRSSDGSDFFRIDMPDISTMGWREVGVMGRHKADTLSIIVKTFLILGLYKKINSECISRGLNRFSYASN